MPVYRLLLTFFLTIASSLAVAHDSRMHHLENHSELTHLLAHLLIGLPVAVGIIACIWIGKTYLVKLISLSERD